MWFSIRRSGLQRPYIVSRCTLAGFVCQCDSESPPCVSIFIMSCIPVSKTMWRIFLESVVLNTEIGFVIAVHVWCALFVIFVSLWILRPSEFLICSVLALHTRILDYDVFILSHYWFVEWSDCHWRHTFASLLPRLCFVWPCFTSGFVFVDYFLSWIHGDQGEGPCPHPCTFQSNDAEVSHHRTCLCNSLGWGCICMYGICPKIDFSIWISCI